ncbi:MAG: LacI family transcriptional regulator [Planctomycetes bacterium]|nr:LacI family transcriptional regulator [Planctomycetota bacterium]
MKNNQTTIKDIARKLNLHHATVSRALRDHYGVSPQTKEKVNALAKELDYNPNSIAQSLKNQKTKTIGVVVPKISHDFFSTVISGIEDVTYKADYSIMVCQSSEDYEREVLNTYNLASNRIAGLLVSIAQNTKNTQHFGSLLHQGVPIVFFDRVCDNIDVSKVVVDDYCGAYKAVEHLILKGYKRIAHLAGPKHLTICRNRLEGYLSALKKYCVPFDEDLVVYGEFDRGSGIAGMKKLLQLSDPPDAIFAINDHVAVGAIMHAKENGLKIPDNIAFVGFGDDIISTVVDPPLTTVAQNQYEIGKTAAELLLDQIENGQDTIVPISKTLKTELIIRLST